MTEENAPPRVSFETFGCSANHADTRLMEHHLQQEAVEIVPTAGDVVVLNTCTVKGPTQTAIEKRIRQLEHEGRTVVVAGCLSQASPEHPLFEERGLLGPDSVDRIGEVVMSSLRGEPVQITKRKRSPLPLVVSEQAPTSPFVLSISQGCLSSCSFCMTKLARGNLRSHPIRHLRDVTAEAVHRGHREIYLTSQDTSAYGLDIGVTLVDLLEALIEIPGAFRIRIGMANPQHFSHFVADLWPLFASEKLYRFLHIPVQSGSEAVLSEMRRDHTAEDYLSVVREGRERWPDLTIATDIICGYPTETARDHEDTIRILRKSAPDAINISKFWPRPKTRAANLTPLPGATVKTRSREITKLFHRIARARNREWLHWSGTVLITEKKHSRLLARNHAYKQVILSENQDHDALAVGDTTNCVIDDYGRYDLRGNTTQH
ncbi:tRNA (N(6)-L-threonylcarbamoyladenosine(37)-C(2))-methylthiotransferase [bacterium]|nr:tRNA (N(6)-L-threonylcarbamoyladenosine(37)-C(2))-methylthiotransferase [bacterium]